MATMWTKKMLKPAILSKINSVDDLLPFAEELVSGLDEAFKKEPDPTTNKKLFTNQTVAGTVTLLVIILEWKK